MDQKSFLKVKKFSDQNSKMFMIEKELIEV